MIAARIIQHMDSDTIKIPNAEQFIGKDVDIIILADSPKISSLKNKSRKRIFGSAKGKISISDDFDKPLPDQHLTILSTVFIFKLSQHMGDHHKTSYRSNGHDRRTF